MPTTAQLSTRILCQRLTNFYRPIFMVRLDKRMDKIYILAGEETEILIDRDGKWEYQ